MWPKKLVISLRLVLDILPAGAVGLMLAVMMAALMSSLSSAFNSSSTIFTMDIWKLFRPRASQKEQLIVGRVVVICLVVIGLLWIPVVSSEWKHSNVKKWITKQTCLLRFWQEHVLVVTLLRKKKA